MKKEERANIATKVTVVGMIVNIILTAAKIIIGFIFNSMALIADGIHSFSDLLSDVFIIVFFQFAKKPADDGHNYGHGRLEVMSEVIVSLMLLFVAIGMIKSGVENIYLLKDNPYTKPSLIVLLVAAASIISKEVLYWYTLHYAKKLKSSAMEANAVHHCSDAISSIAVFVALGMALVLGQNWYILDPIIAICVAIYIITIAIKILIKSFNVLTDGAIDKTECAKILEILNSIPETSDPHHVRTRRIGSYIAVELHIRVNAEMKVKDAHKIATSIENKLKDEFGQDTFVSVHIEPSKVNGEYVE